MYKRQALQFAPDETEPSLLDGEVFVTGENTKATAITNFTDAEAGVVYTIYGSGSEYASTIAAGGNFVLTEAMTLSEGKFIKLAKPICLRICARHPHRHTSSPSSKAS